MKIFLLSTVLSFFLAGCAITRSDAKLDYPPETIVPPATAKAWSGATIHGIVVTDDRMDIFTKKSFVDKRVLLNKRNGRGGRSEGVYAVPKPLEDYVRQAFQQGFAQASIVESQESSREIGIRIDVLIDRWLGKEMFKDPTGYLVIEVTATVSDMASHKQLWSDTLLGTSQIKVEGLFLSAEDVARTLPKTLASLVNRCLSSPGFQAALLRGVELADLKQRDHAPDRAIR